MRKLEIFSGLHELYGDNFVGLILYKSKEGRFAALILKELPPIRFEEAVRCYQEIGDKLGVEGCHIFSLREVKKLFKALRKREIGVFELMYDPEGELFKML